MSEQTQATEGRSKNSKSSESHAKAAQGEASFMPPTEETQAAESKGDDVMAKAATIAVVGVGVALISAEFLPGMLIGVAAAMLPGIGPKVKPFLKTTVKAGYTAVRKTREMIAEAGEQVQDLIAEAKSEETHSVNGSKPSA